MSGTQLQNPDFAAYARAFGGHGARVERTEEFAPVLVRLRAQAQAARLPVLLHCLIDPEAITPSRSLSQIRGGWVFGGQQRAVDAYRLPVNGIKSRRMAILSFNCAETQRLFCSGTTRRFANIQAVAERKLAQLDAAQTLDFLRSPPGNRLEMLTGNRKGQHSIRINDQWRLCFVWTDKGATNAEIVDYH